MKSLNRVQELLVQWEELREQGRSLSPEELCAECPELIGEVAEQIKVFQNLDSLWQWSDEKTTDKSQSSDGTLPIAPQSRPSEPTPFLTPERFEIKGELGRGGMGVVYRAWDRKREEFVALKTLQHAAPDSLLRFKQEFRTLADDAHPNWVSLYELVSDGDHWFFTMQIVDGVDFLQYVRGEPPVSAGGEMTGGLKADQLQRLHHALCGLADGLQALHDAGKLHRDIKPSNVMVTKNETVVILDFGLATALDVAGLHHTAENHIMGTIPYMSPEQSAASPVGPPTDWYAVGVMLFQALTNQYPFDGTIAQILRAKEEQDPPSPRDLVDNVPDEWNQLCCELLRRDAEQRLTGPQLLERLQSKRGESQPQSGLRFSPPRSAPLVGRRDQLALLQKNLDDVRAGKTAALFIQGKSGTGKSTLVRHFLQTIRAEGVVALCGRCYQQESVPYKAFDSLIDELSQYLSTLSSNEAAAVSPPAVRSLMRVFPMLEQAVRGRIVEPDIADAQELRRRAFAGLRELFTRLGSRVTLVLFIDDLQWGDKDSAALMNDLLRLPNPPKLLLLGCHRDGDTRESDFLRGVLGDSSSRSNMVAIERMHLEPLTPDDAQELARQLLDTQDANVQQRAATIARESRGNPFFVTELARHIHGNIATGQASDDTAALSLDGVLWNRIQQLPGDAQRMMEALAVAGQPIQQNIAAHAVGLQAVAPALLIFLRTHRFIRVARPETDEIEIYHDRFRETILAHLPDDTVKALHLQLAAGLEQEGGVDAERLAVHYLGADDAAKAGRYYLQSAGDAAEALAFEHAAHLYGLAINLTDPQGDARRDILKKMGAAWANAGHGGKAAEAFQEAAGLAESRESLELQRDAAEQLLLSGRVTEGLAVMERILRYFGWKLNVSSLRSIAGYILRRFQLRLRGLGFRERAESELDPDTLLKIDTCWAVAIGLSHVDPLRGAGYQLRHLLLALHAGEPYRIARALSMEVVHSACDGGAGHAKTMWLYEHATKLAEQVNHPHATAMRYLCGGMAAFLEGDWKRALQLSEQSDAVLRQECTGVAWEIHSANFYAIRSLEFLGEWAELARRFPAFLDDATKRGDVLAATNLQTRVAYFVHLMNDEPDIARQTLHEGIERWKNQGVHLQHYFELMATVDIAHYADDAHRAWDFVDQRWLKIFRSLLMRLQTNRLSMHHLHGRSALALAAKEPHRRAELLPIVDKDAKAMMAEDMSWSNPIADLLFAGKAAVQGDLYQASAHLMSAETGFTKANMELYRYVVRWRRGQLSGSEAGRAMIDEARRWMIGQTIRNPESILKMYAPGFDG